MTQSRFAQALLDPAADPPSGLVRPDGMAAPRRFAVYRNNVAVGLTEALQTAFPVVRKLVGEAFFAAMAGTFLRRHPPQSRIMMLYGADFPGFLASFPPVAHLAYLPDVARLEQALRESYHAADAEPVKTEALTALGEEALLAARLTLAPAVRLIRSPWPIHAIWLANTRDGPAVSQQSEDVVVLRALLDPEPHLLGKGGGAFLGALLSGHALDLSLAAAGPEFDLAPTLALLLNSHSITGIAP